MNKFVTALASMARVLVRPFFSVKYYGERELPMKKTLLVGNHISGWDPVVFTMWCKTWVSFVYKAEFRKSAFLRWVFDGLDFVPVKRGEVDLYATKTIMKLLREERVVGLFPEGTRNPNVDCLQDFHTGAAMFAIKTKSPMRAFYTWEKAKLFRKNYIIVGEEFTLEEFYDKPVTKELLRQATEKIKKQVDDLRLQLNDILEQKGVKRRHRTKKEMEKIKRYNERQKTLAKELAKQQSSQEDSE